MLEGEFRVSYPPDTTALYKDRVVRVIQLFGPATGPSIESADLASASAVIAIDDATVETVPFSEISVPEYGTGEYYAVLAEHESSDFGGGPDQPTIFRAAGRRPEHQWGSRWGDDPWTLHYQWSEREGSAAQAIGERIRGAVPTARVGLSRKRLSFAHPAARR